MNIFQEYLSYGLSVIPTKNKICRLSSWAPYQKDQASQDLAKGWDGDVAIICGQVSGGLVCIDFDVKNGDKFSDWFSIIATNHQEILKRLVIEQTPSLGFHVVFRTKEIIKNTKLACNQDRKATIETRGEGGYFVAAPSENYSICSGSFSHLEILSKEETELIINLCVSFNEYANKEIVDTKTVVNQVEGNITPFDDYDSKNNVTDILQPLGWRLCYTHNNIQYWRRPGKNEGISASWNYIPNRFFVFTTSTQFENEHVYKASAVYTMVCHSGNYNESAKTLYTNGYGSRMVREVEKPKAKMIDSSNIREKIMDIYENGYRKGKSTGWRCLDRHYSVIKGQFTVVTGMPSHGKSEFVDALMMNLAKKEGWKFAVFAPENYPVEMHYHKLIEKYTEKSLTKQSVMTTENIDEALKFIDEHFFFIDATEDEINIQAVLDQAQKLILDKKIDGLCLDPWNEIELDKPKDTSSTEFIGKCLRISRKFARRNNIHLWIVAHPIKMAKDRITGTYPVPELYDIEGSAHWRNKADNGICVHRKDFESSDVSIIIQKIKYRYAGSPGEAILKYNNVNGTYEETKQNGGYNGSDSRF
jgi:hypothetical protein